MDDVSTGEVGGANPDEERGELAELVAELVRKGWELQIRAVPNDLGTMAEAEIVFENLRLEEPPRTVQQEMQAVSRGLAPQVPVHWKFDPFDPYSIYKAVKRFHHLFVENAPSA